MASLAHRLESELPRLRRFGCLFTGSMAAGDALLRQALLAQVEATAQDPPDAARLLRLMISCAAGGGFAPAPPLGLVQSDDSDGHDGDGHDLAAGLLALPPAQRVATLLLGVENFSYGDAAAIAGVTEFEIRRDLMAGRRMLMRRAMPPVLVIENEQLVGAHIAGILEDMGHRVCGVASNGAEALDLARRQRPSLILADIDLGDGASGIDVGQEIVRLTQAKLIYVTGYPSRVIADEQVGQAWMVLAKPFAAESLRVAVNRAMVA